MKNKRKELRTKYQDKTGESFKDIPINGLHLGYIEWLENLVLNSSQIDVETLGSNEAKKEPCSHIRKKQSTFYKGRMSCIDCGELI